MYALDAAKQWADIDVVKADDLPKYDAIILGTPTRFGVMAA